MATTTIPATATATTPATDIRGKFYACIAEISSIISAMQPKLETYAPNSKMDVNKLMFALMNAIQNAFDVLIAAKELNRNAYTAYIADLYMAVIGSLPLTVGEVQRVRGQFWELGDNPSAWVVFVKIVAEWRRLAENMNLTAVEKFFDALGVPA
jgi:hypothetical protein